MLLLLACFSDPPPPPEPPFEQRRIDVATMERAFPSDRVKDRAGWGKDLYEILLGHKLDPTIGNACAVAAVVEQESGFQPDPAVPGIGTMIDTWIAQKEASMGKIPGWAFDKGLKAVLNQKQPGQTISFYDRLHAAKTERDVDRAFREFVEWQRSKLPAPLRAAEKAAQAVGLDMDDYNPITTAGCMQVKVDFAEEESRKDGKDPEQVRESLYTRAGCLHYGTVRLLAWEAAYDSPLYRFADYNAGTYASRNAAFQESLAILTGVPLAMDGDLLAYDKNGRPSADPSQTLQAALKLAESGTLSLSPTRVTWDMEKEKTQAFEETDTYKQVQQLAQKKTGVARAYARMPDVHLDSIKLSGDKTTAWYAKNVQLRYNRCLTRMKT